MNEKILAWVRSHRVHTIAAIVIVAAALIIIVILGAFGKSAGEKSEIGKTVKVEEAGENAGDDTDAGSDVDQEAEEVIEKTDADSASGRPTESGDTPSDKSPASGGNNSSASDSGSGGSESPSGEVSSGGAPSGGSGSSDSGSGSVHQHNWQAHQVWVPNIVTVEDAPEQTVHGARLYTQQGDGSIANGETYWFENGFTIDNLKEIIKNKIRNEGYIGSYQNLQKTVPAVTHTEDQGSYQIDYYYCECGATK